MVRGERKPENDHSQSDAPMATGGASFTWRGNPRVFGGHCVMMSSIAGEQPQLRRSAHGDPISRSLRSNGRHSDGNARRRRIPRLVCLYNRYASLRLCRSLLSFAFNEIMGARLTTRTRGIRPASSRHQSRTGMSVPCPPKHLSTLAHSDSKRASRRSLANSSSEGLCRPICADCAARKLHVCCDMHLGCMCAASSCWIAPGEQLPVTSVCSTVLFLRSDSNCSAQNGLLLQLIPMI